LRTDRSDDAEELPDGAPKTFKKEYSGAGSQASGVAQTMQMVADNLHKEAEAFKLYTGVKTELTY
jgi:hypothetical protein